MKIYGNVEAWLHVFLNLVLGGSEWSTLATLLLGKSPKYLLGSRVGGPQIVSWHFGKEKSAHLFWEFNLSSPVVQPSHYTASLQSVIIKKIKRQRVKQYLSES